MIDTLKQLIQTSRLLVIGIVSAFSPTWTAGFFSLIPPTPIPQPIADPLAIPVLPENPTQVQRGEVAYYYHCMPCHGDRGQGLTDDFRSLWVEDHQNCWAVGCHGGRVSDEGFPIPRSVPPVNSPTSILTKFPEAESLYSYLQSTHPPQRPGALEDEDYWDLTGFIRYMNGLQAGDEISGTQPPATIQLSPPVASLIFIFLMGILCSSLIIQARSPK